MTGHGQQSLRRHRTPRRVASLPRVTAVLVGTVAAALALGACSATPTASTHVGTSTVSPSTSTTESTTVPATTPTTSPAETTSTTVSATGCQATNLGAALAGSEGAAGTIELTFSLKNTAGASCAMNGYPDVQLLDSTEASMATAVNRGGGLAFENIPASNVTLAAGQSAYFNLGYSDVTVGTETSCPAAAQVRITPPGSTSSAVVPVSDLDACGGGTVHVSPVFASTNSSATATTAPPQN